MTLRIQARPCKTCPFTDREFGLRDERRAEIVETLRSDGSFFCHSTVDYDGDSDGVVTTDSQLCVGAMVLCERDGFLPQLARIQERLVKRTIEYDGTRVVYESLDDFVGDVEMEGDPCSVVNPGCVAPAGFFNMNGSISAGAEAAEFECYVCGEAVCGSCSVERAGRRLCGWCDESDDRINS